MFLTLSGTQVGQTHTFSTNPVFHFLCGINGIWMLISCDIKLWVKPIFSSSFFFLLGNDPENNLQSNYKLRFINELIWSVPKSFYLPLTLLYSFSRIKAENEEHLLKWLLLININPFMNNDQLNEKEFLQKRQKSLLETSIVFLLSQIIGFPKNKKYIYSFIHQKRRRRKETLLATWWHGLYLGKRKYLGGQIFVLLDQKGSNWFFRMSAMDFQCSDPSAIWKCIILLCL